MKAISHAPDRDRVLPIAPEGTCEKEGGRQRERSRGRQLKNADKESINHRHENMGVMDNGECSGNSTTDTNSFTASVDSNVCPRREQRGSIVCL